MLFMEGILFAIFQYCPALINKLKLQVCAEAGIYHGTGHISNYYLSLSHNSNTCTIILNCNLGENIEIL